MKNLLLASLIFSSLAVSAAFAGNEKGNGGDGLWLNGKLYSLDLVEAGVEENPYYDTSTQLDPLIQTRLAAKFNDKVFPVRLLALKLSEISSVNKLFATVILKGIEMYQWRVVNSSLIDIKDEDSVLNYPKKNIVQLASRRLNVISIDKSLWAQLDDHNKTALIFHEIMYAMDIPHFNPRTGHYEQSSAQARQITGYLFTPDLVFQGNNGLQNLNLYYENTDSLILETAGKNDILANPEYIVVSPNSSSNNMFTAVSKNFSEDEIKKSVAIECELAYRSHIGVKMELLTVVAIYTVEFAYYSSDGEERKYLKTSKSSAIVEPLPLPSYNVRSCIEFSSSAIMDFINSKKNYR